MLSLGGSGGQSLEDKFNAVKCFISGQGLLFVVLKATTSEMMGPKKKHLTYLVNITHEPNISIPNLAKYLMQRARYHDWTVVYKSLITIHYLINYGNERFIQNLASSNENYRSFNDYLTRFNDKSTSLSYNMSIFLRRYSRYLTGKINSYKLLGYDFCRISSQNSCSPPLSTESTAFSKEKSSKSLINLRPAICNDVNKQFNKKMPFQQLMLTLPIIQDLFDQLVAFDAGLKDLTNGIINTSFSMLYKDFVKLYIIYQTLIIRLLELYFESHILKQVDEMLTLYKKFLIRMDKVSDFMRIVDSIGMDKRDMPNVPRSPALALNLLERHLLNLQAENKLKRTRRESFNADGQIYGSLSGKLPVVIPLVAPNYGTLQLMGAINKRPGRRRSVRAQSSLDLPMTPEKPVAPVVGPISKMKAKFEPISKLDEQQERAIATSEVFDSHSKLQRETTVGPCDTSILSSQCSFTTSRSRFDDDDYIFSTDLVQFETIKENLSEAKGGQKEENDRQSLLLMGDSLDLAEPEQTNGQGADGPKVNRPNEWVQVDL